MHMNPDASARIVGHSLVFNFKKKGLFVCLFVFLPCAYFIFFFIYVVVPMEHTAMTVCFYLVLSLAACCASPWEVYFPQFYFHSPPPGCIWHTFSHFPRWCSTYSYIQHAALLNITKLFNSTLLVLPHHTI